MYVGPLTAICSVSWILGRCR